MLLLPSQKAAALKKEYNISSEALTQSCEHTKEARLFALLYAVVVTGLLSFKLCFDIKLDQVALDDALIVLPAPFMAYVAAKMICTHMKKCANRLETDLVVVKGAMPREQRIEAQGMPRPN